jgi:DNA-binding NarL/FixJ family response regulator
VFDRQARLRLSVALMEEPLIGVLVVENHWVWADAVAHQIDSMPGVRKVGPVATMAEALELSASEDPRLALVDLLLGGESGLRIARALRSRHPRMQIVVMTVEPSAGAIAEAREIGLAGFVCKDDLLEGSQIQRLIASLARSQEVYSPRVLRIEAAAAVGAGVGLSEDEVELIRCFARGWGTAETARILCIAPQTIRNRTTKIGQLLGVSGRLEIVAKAYELGIIAPPTAQGPR